MLKKGIHTDLIYSAPGGVVGITMVEYGGLPDLAVVESPLEL